jgi:hypothetical protein
LIIWGEDNYHKLDIAEAERLCDLPSGCDLRYYAVSAELENQIAKMDEEKSKTSSTLC